MNRHGIAKLYNVVSVVNKKPPVDIMHNYLEKLYENVLKLLKNVGLKVESPLIRDILCEMGADVAGDRVCFPQKMIDDIIEEQKEYKEKSSSTDAAISFSPIFPDSEIFVFDFSKQERHYATIDDAIDCLKVQHMMSEIQYVRSPFVLNGFDPLTEPLRRYILAYEVSSKPKIPIGYWDSRLIPYLLELDSIAGFEKGSYGFFSANATVSPLLVDGPTCNRMLEKAKNGITNEGFTTMATSGGNTPVAVEGAALVGAAELLGGAICADAINKKYGFSDYVPISGYAVTGSLNMKNLQGAFGSPEAIRQDYLIHKLFKTYFFTDIGFGPDYVDAKLPGMQCVMERIMKCYAQISAGFYQYFESYSLGQMMGSTVFCNIQAMIDLEMGKALYRVFCEEPVDSIDEIYDEIESAVRNETTSFIMNESTLNSYAKNWYSFLYDYRFFSDINYYDTEETILKTAAKKWDGLLNGYRCDEIDYDAVDRMNKFYRKAIQQLDGESNIRR